MTPGLPLRETFRGPPSALSCAGLGRVRRVLAAWAELAPGIERETFAGRVAEALEPEAGPPPPAFGEAEADAAAWAAMAGGEELRAYGAAAAAELRRRGLLRRPARPK